MKIEIRETMDGSQTLYLEEIDEHYHSTFGAIQESQHVFIREGLERCPAKEISLLEIGFGTGLNCYLTLMNCLKRDQNISYFSVEKNPLPEELWDQLNYSLSFQDDDAEFFKLLHKAPWNCVVAINDHFSICKIEGDVLQYDLLDLPIIDLVYFDAFSPDKQPELWEKPLFEKIFSKMNANGILVTYCAKGHVRRLLQAVGFCVERVPGPPGKREMLRAVKQG
jgi:tRNA U34 5-methylaminomethyl-2-thiouridine-forming methyltransferase MnmC